MRVRVSVAVCAAVLATAATAARASSFRLPASSVQLPAASPQLPVSGSDTLDVPYIQQSEALCGGAAAAMVMRYWGATGVYAETFAPLVNDAARGIRGDVLLNDLRGRGWDARSFRGDAALVLKRLRDRQPVIALIEDRPGAYHYVVVVAWSNERVVVHDPARAPFRVLDQAAFEVAWSKSDRWTMLLLPGEALRRPADSTSPRAAPVSRESACDAAVDDAVRSAEQGNYDRALETLRSAAETCPNASGPLREMAGVYAVREDWRSAAAYARAAVRRKPEDAHAWRILATSSFVTGDSQTALRAWNQLGEPRIDLVSVKGLERTRHRAATSLMRLEPQALLSAGGLSAANRRLDELPAAQSSIVSYRPLPGGNAAVDAVVLERPRAPTTLRALALVGFRAVAEREVSGWFTNPTGAGDAIHASWRYWENRPRFELTYAAPAPLGGILRADIYRDVQTYGLSPAAPPRRQVRSGGSMRLADWTTRDLRWEVGAGVDAWSQDGKTFAVTADAEQRLMGDRLTLAGGATALTGTFTATGGTALVEWRSAVRHEGQVIMGRIGTQVVSHRAPLALWPGAGVGHARSILLRAHPLLEDGTVTGDMFGRWIAHAGGEWRRWFKPGLGIVPVGPALFVDVARAENRLQPGEAWHADAGIGARIAVPGGNVLRVDLARGLRDGKVVLSVGFLKR